MSEASGREEREASTCLLHKGGTLFRSVPLLLCSLIPLCVPTFLLLLVGTKKGGAQKDEDGSPVHLCNFLDLPIQREKNRQQEESNKHLTNVRFFQEKKDSDNRRRTTKR